MQLLLRVDLQRKVWYNRCQQAKETVMKETFYKYDVPAKICLLADIHDQPFDEVSASLRRQKPDIIAIAGDILRRVRRDTSEPVILQPQYSLDFVKACAACASHISTAR